MKPTGLVFVFVKSLSGKKSLRICLRSMKHMIGFNILKVNIMSQIPKQLKEKI